MSCCGQLRSVWLRQAPRLSDDAVAYLSVLERLKDLSLAGACGLTDRCLRELPGQLRCLDLAGCRQLTEGAVVDFARKVGCTLRVARRARWPAKVRGYKLSSR